MNQVEHWGQRGRTLGLSDPSDGSAVAPSITFPPTGHAPLSSLGRVAMVDMSEITNETST
jgi:hypothetical protein